MESRAGGRAERSWGGRSWAGCWLSRSSSPGGPPPLVLWDQTLWALGPAVNGLFSGSSQATFYVTPQSSFSQTTTIQGIATEEGQIRMKFTPTSGGDPIIGIGQFRSVRGRPSPRFGPAVGSTSSGTWMACPRSLSPVRSSSAAVFIRPSSCP